VTTNKIADNAVNTAQITDGAVTTAKLNLDAGPHLNDNTLFLRSTNTGPGLAYSSSFGGQSVDGPALFGTSGGVLGTTSSGQKAALVWTDDKSVTTKGAMTMEGPVSLFARPVDATKLLPGDGEEAGSVWLTNKVEGLLMFYVGHATCFIQVTNVTKGLYFDNQQGNGGMILDGTTAGAFGTSFTWPVFPGDMIYINCKAVNGDTAAYRNRLYIIPLGVNSSTTYTSLINTYP